MEYEKHDYILPPYIIDIFTLDVICEFVTSPLLFVSYINRRLNYFDKIMANHERTVLSYHLTHNLCLFDDIDTMALHDDISAPVDIAMMARREGFPGKKDPPGILTKFFNTNYWHLIEKLEYREEPISVELGLMLLKLGEKAILNINKKINFITKRSASGKRLHDATFHFDYGFGLSIYSQYQHDGASFKKIRTHSELKKYQLKSNLWFGIIIKNINQYWDIEAIFKF